MALNSGDGAEPFAYDLPPERIAQRPVHPPESARLMVVESDGAVRESIFSDLGQELRRGDLLVFNHTRVFPARFRGTVSGRQFQAELLLVARIGEAQWRCLAKPLKKLATGSEIDLGGGLRGVVDQRIGDKEICVTFSAQSGSVDALMQSIGQMPIPPYIRRGISDDEDRHDYQSIFAENVGSIAAPTASLHFSRALVDHLALEGIERAALTLHLGTASFLPLFSLDEPARITPPGAERYIHSTALLDTIAAVRARGGRVFAVGTSVVRALESMARCAAKDGAECESSLFITPGFEFLALDGMITNFHQPGTTHLLLVEAFVGRESLERAYRHALEREFRFLSYGDGMILLPRK